MKVLTLIEDAKIDVGNEKSQVSLGMGSKDFKMIHWESDKDRLASIIKDIFLRYSNKYSIPNNGVVYLQEDVAEKFYVVLSGYVKLTYILEDGTNILYSILPPGSSFGELGAFDGSRYADTASAIGQVSVLAVRSSVFNTDSANASELRAVLSALIAERYRDYMELTRGLFMNSLSARLAMCVVRLVRSVGQEFEFNGKLYPCLCSMITQSDLGSMARGTRGNVNRVLKKWERRGLVALQDRNIVILSLKQLEFLAKGGGAE